MSRTVAQVRNTVRRPSMAVLPVPKYLPSLHGHSPEQHLGLTIASMRNHMTDEGDQLFQALKVGGYELCGKGLDIPITDVRALLMQTDPKTLVLQDKREWEGKTAKGSGFDEGERFTNVTVLKERADIFKLTVLKDAQNSPGYHATSAHEIGCHAWIVYYHPTIVKAVAPYVREQHLIRTYHTIDPEKVPTYLQTPWRDAVISGATGGAYPLRSRIIHYIRMMGVPGNVDWLRHPGYHKNGCDTPAYLEELSKYKVAICTSSKYGYALRKLIEATACGCRVITDLPSDEVLPIIDGNLTRVHVTISTKQMEKVVRELCESYDRVQQEEYAALCKGYYSYKSMGIRLAVDIENMRRSYNK